MRGILSFLVSLLVLTACAGGSGGGSSGGDSPTGFEADFTFTPMPGGIRIASPSDFGDFTSLNITATSGGTSISRVVPITAFSGDGHPFAGLNDQSDWKFEIRGILSDGSQQQVRIDFIWQENRLDHASGGIRPGANHDRDGRADIVDNDDDNDGVNDDEPDRCSTGETNWISNGSSDNDGDGCRDRDEDPDDDNDGLGDGLDRCSTGETNWTRNASSDNDGDGCRDDGEDIDDDNDNILDSMDTGTVDGRVCRLHEDCDNDGLGDNHSIEQQTNLNNVRCSLLADCDDDDVRDGDEAAGCVLKVDCDNDGTDDNLDQCPAGVTSGASTDTDGDGCRDESEDIDDDGDGLIEIATPAELDAVRYALSGNGSRSSGNAALNTTGCGGDDGITSCSGYELIANISLAGYANWRPLGHDTDPGTNGCQGAAFEGVFEGNGWTISNLSISRSSQDCVGLFGHVATDATIRNLTLRAETVIGRDSVGTLAGDASGAQLFYSSVEVDEVRGGGDIGGLIGGGRSARIHSSSVVAEEVRGADSDVGGLVGGGRSAQIHSSSVVAEEVRGITNVGGLVGGGRSAQIHSSSVVAEEVRGAGSDVGGLVGNGQSAQIHSSSVLLHKVRGDFDNTGGLVGWGQAAQIHSSLVVAGNVSGGRGAVGGLVGWGQSAQIHSSSVVVGEISGRVAIGGLVGRGRSARIHSSSVVVGEVRSLSLAGGLVGDGSVARILSSLVVAAEVDGATVGGLAATFNSDSRVAYSYVVSDSQAVVLVGAGMGEGVDSYWYNATMGFAGGNHGEAKTSNELQMPMGYTGIYDTWDDNPITFSDGMIDEPLAVWCDEDNSGSIEGEERILGNRIWDFGTNTKYPAIRCTPIDPDYWRGWWSLDGDGEPQLNQTRLDNLLP